VHDASRATGLGVPVLVVHDTLHGAWRLGTILSRRLGAAGGGGGRLQRQDLHQGMLKAALGARFHVHATTAT